MYDHCDPIEGYHEKLVKARKPHKCCETGRTIEKGEMHWVMGGICDGEPTRMRQCRGAYHFARKVSRLNPDGCVPFGQIGEFVGESCDKDLIAEWERVVAGEVTCED